MACRCLLSSYSSSPLPPNPKTPKPKSSISSNLSTTPDNNDDSENDKTKLPKPNFDFLKLSVTLTVISASLPQTSRAAVKAKKPRAKKSDALSPQELKSWSQGLPVVSNRIPYTRLLDLRRDSKLKRVVKPPAAELRQKAEPVLVVLEDSRVLRTVLPPAETDRRFWEEWERLGFDSLCVNAYTPPLKPPEVPLPYLSFLARMPAVVAWFSGAGKPARKESKRAAELRRAREEFKAQRKEELERMRSEREMIDKAMKAQKKEEERRLRREARKKKHDESLREARQSYLEMANVWAALAQDSNVATALGLVFFYIFYRTVVLSYRRQKKDYEDRLKIEQAEAEERKKMRDLERMEGIEGGEEDEEGEMGKGEQNPYMKMAMQFMRSGARVRRAHNKRMPQYLERGVDVKFTDVAGLGKIRLELEEIVKFFTHGEMYRRRGVKIPGWFLSQCCSFIDIT